ncbi:histidine phosphatase family protein [Bowdeniella massiliensis]|uniref:histidine phosphatase family protein n=1 Tax=Bowdeniella massiliensis TaxID=2932264 RepID=UPI002028192D
MTTDRVVFVRHGQTDHNADGRVQGQIDIPLNEVGRQQAAAAARSLAQYLDTRPVRMVSSDLSRALATAEAIAERLDAIVETDIRLRERGFGAFEGLSGAELAEKYPEPYALWRAGGSPEGLGLEEKIAVGTRMAQGVMDYVDKGERGSTLIVVSHGSAITQTLRSLLGVQDTAQPVFRGLDNCHWTEIESGIFADRPGWRLRVHNMGPW